MQYIKLSEIHVKCSVIVIVQKILLALEMKGQVLYRKCAHLNGPGWQPDLSALLTKKLIMFLSRQVKVLSVARCCAKSIINITTVKFRFSNVKSVKKSFTILSQSLIHFIWLWSTLGAADWETASANIFIEMLKFTMAKTLLSQLRDISTSLITLKKTWRFVAFLSI